MFLQKNIVLRISQRRFLIADAVRRVISRGCLILFQEVDLFDRLFADYIGAQNCIDVANGIDAIGRSLKAVGVSSGDYVATVANTGANTTTAMLAIGVKPFYAAVNPDSMNVPLAEIERAIRGSDNALVVKRRCGLAVPKIDAISQLCKGHNVTLLENGAQAHRAFVNSLRFGSFGDAASFSFYPTKNLGAVGDGNLDRIRRWGDRRAGAVRRAAACMRNAFGRLPGRVWSLHSIRDQALFPSVRCASP